MDERRIINGDAYSMKDAEASLRVNKQGLLGKLSKETLERQLNVHEKNKSRWVHLDRQMKECAGGRNNVPLN